MRVNVLVSRSREGTGKEKRKRTKDNDGRAGTPNKHRRADEDVDELEIIVPEELQRRTRPPSSNNTSSTSSFSSSIISTSNSNSSNNAHSSSRIPRQCSTSSKGIRTTPRAFYQQQQLRQVQMFRAPPSPSLFTKWSLSHRPFSDSFPFHLHMCAIVYLLSRHVIFSPASLNYMHSSSSTLVITILTCAHSTLQ